MRPISLLIAVGNLASTLERTPDIASNVAGHLPGMLLIFFLIYVQAATTCSQFFLSAFRAIN